MPSILCIGDIHYKKDNVPDSIALTKRILELITEHKPDICVFLGDCLDRFEDIKMGPQKRVIDVFSKCMRLITSYNPNGLLVVLVGNHERPNPEKYEIDDHPYTALYEWKNTILVEKPEILIYEGIPLLLMPYVPPGTFLQHLEIFDRNTLISCTEEYPYNPCPSRVLKLDNEPNKETSEKESKTEDFSLMKREEISLKTEGVSLMKSWREVTLGFSHQEFTGSVYNTRLSEVETWDKTYPMLFNGHIHAHQLAQKNLLNVGAPIQHKFEDEVDKYIALINIKSRDDYSYDLIPVKVTNKTKLVINVEDLSTFSPPEGQEEFLRSQLKITIVGPKGTKKNLENNSKIKAWKKAGIIIVYEEEKSTPEILKGFNNEKGKSFREYLYEDIKDDERLLKLYNRLFNKRSRRVVVNE